MRILIFAFATLLVVLQHEPLFASGYRGEDGNLSIRGGIIGSGTVEFRDFEYDQQSAYTLGASYDVGISERFFFGISGDLHRMDWQNALMVPVGKANMIDVAVGLKYRLSISDGLVQIRPGFALGVGILQEIAGLKNSRFLTIKATTELIFYLFDDTGFLLEAGLLTAPNGRDEVNDINLKPLSIFRFGLVF